MKSLFFLILFYVTLATSAQESLRSTLPATIVAGHAYKFQVTVTKGQADNFSKYQIDLPPGVSVSEVDSRGGAFSFENNRGKIIWVNTPREPEFTIILSLQSGTFTGQGYIHQKFYFIENETRRELQNGPMPVLFTANGTNAALPPEQAITADQGASMPAKQPRNQNKNEVAAGNLRAPEKAVVPTTSAVTAGNEEAIVYRVQLSSGTEKPGLAKYAGIKDLEVVKEAGQYKLLAGKTGHKDEAIQLRNDLAAKGFNGFVVAYRNGQRVK